MGHLATQEIILNQELIIKAHFSAQALAADQAHSIEWALIAALGHLAAQDNVIAKVCKRVPALTHDTTQASSSKSRFFFYFLKTPTVFRFELNHKL